jgi:hypothetical protein
MDRRKKEGREGYRENGREEKYLALQMHFELEK